MTIRLNKEKTFQTIINDKEIPYLTAIDVLEELVDQYNKNILEGKDNNWKIDYADFKERFRFSYSMVKQAIKILNKKFNFITIKRSFDKTRKLKNGSESYVALNIDKLHILEDEQK